MEAGAAEGAPAPQPWQAVEDMEIHDLWKQSSEPWNWADEEPTIQDHELSAANKLLIPELVAYWEQNRGSLQGVTWLNQLKNKIKELHPGANVSLPIAALTKKLLVLLLCQYVKEDAEYLTVPDEGAEIMITPGSPYVHRPIFAELGEASPGMQTYRVIVKVRCCPVSPRAGSDTSRFRIPSPRNSPWARPVRSARAGCRPGRRAADQPQRAARSLRGRRARRAAGHEAR